MRRLTFVLRPVRDVLGREPDDARYRVQVALKVIGQLLPAGVGERT